MDSLRRKIAPQPLPKPSLPPSEPIFIPPTPPVQKPAPEAVPVFQPVNRASSAPIKKFRPEKKRIWVRLLIVFLIVTLFLFASILIAGFRTIDRIQIKGSTTAAPSLTQKLKTLQAAFLPGERAPLTGEDRGRINILLLGKAGEGLPGENLTDTLMLASINTKTGKVALLSLPRDLYVENRSSGESGKINTFYQRSLSRDEEPLTLIKDTITLITGEPVDYFVVMNFSGFEQIVDALGGITVDVPKDFYDPRYPGKNYSYETFELKKGRQKLDGSTALKYVRERHDDPEGDFGRAKRQQQVLQAMRDKAESPGTFLNFFRIHRLFEGVADNVETDITLPELHSFYELSKSLDTDNVTNKVVDAWKPESLLRVDHKVLGGVRAFTLVPRTGTWEETRDVAKNIFDLEALTKRQEALRKEKARILILDPGETLSSANKLAQYIERELGMQASVRYEPALESGRYSAILVPSGISSKPYSMDELLKRLPLKRGDTLPLEDTENSSADFFLVMDSALAESFQNADAFYTEELQMGKDETSDTPINE